MNQNFNTYRLTHKYSCEEVIFKTKEFLDIVNTSI